MIEVKELEKSYGSLQVLKKVSLSVENNKVVSIVGPSGAGKSTLLHIIGTLDKPDKGEVVIDGVSVDRLDDDKLAEFRNKHIGFVYQFHHLLPEFTAIENVAMPALIAGTKKQAAFSRAKELLEFMKLSERMEHKPSELSGGEQQRVSVARALVNNPKLILADEPSGNLDTENARKLHDLFFVLRDTFKQTFVIVTHNEELAQLSDKTIMMQDGKIL